MSTLDINFSDEYLKPVKFLQLLLKLSLLISYWTGSWLFLSNGLIILTNWSFDVESIANTLILLNQQDSNCWLVFWAAVAAAQKETVTKSLFDSKFVDQTISKHG